MISMTQYWMGRDKVYAADLTDKIRTNALQTVAVLNMALSLFSKDTGIVLTQVASGWRPPEVNCETSNAADHSRHLTAEAGDIRDTENRDFARWCCKNQAALARIGLWLERFEWTSKKNADGEWISWVHMQIVPPLSGRRFYIPSTAPALVARLPEQDQFNC